MGKDASKWSNRDILAVFYIIVCIFFAWFISLSNLIFAKHFPDRAYALEQCKNDSTPIGDTFFPKEEESYWGPRWLYFAPHVFSAIVWWNLSWMQLIKWIRAKHLWLHRWNGRIQVVAMFCQIITGLGLASKSPTPVVQMLATCYGLSMAYVLGQTVYHISRKDIVRHKYWATKLFGYAQAIALQRIFTFIFFVMITAGVPLYTPLDQLHTEEERNLLAKQMFSDSFSMCIFSAIILTEWYQAADHNDLLEYRVKEAKEKLPQTDSAAQALIG